jgi:alpha-1,6-mannosyltransferase
MVADGAAVSLEREVRGRVSRRLKVCDLALFSPSSSSGVRTYIASKIDYVRERDDLDHVVIVPGDCERVSTEGRSKVIVVRGVPSPYPDVRLGLNLIRIARLIAKEAPDVIEVNCQYTLAWAAFLATRASRAPIVGVYHTDVPACAGHWARRAGTAVASVVERAAEFYMGLIYRHCTMTILLNPAMYERVARLGVSRTRCLPCGVDSSRFTPARRDPAFRQRLGVTSRQKIVFYAGRLSPEKELEVLLAAFERLPHGDFVLAIAGDGPDACDVRRYAGTHPDVRLLGHIDSRGELATAFASSDLFVIPGRHETFGMATLEAISSGLPVVGIANSGTATFVPPWAGVMVAAGDSAGMAAAILTVASWDPVTTRRACHDFASTHFSWRRVLDGYFAAYRELIDGAATGCEARA